jgi:hypothetical protein
MECDQGVFIQFLWNEKIDAHEIIHKLQAQFGEYAYVFRTFRFWIAEVWLGHQDLHEEIRTGRPPLDDCDAKILAILDKSPFESARSITETLCIAQSTMLQHLHGLSAFRSFHLHWMPHLLIHDFGEKRKDYAKAIFPFLHAAERNSWHHLVISDELWFFWNTLPRRMWTLSRDDVVTKTRLDIRNKNTCLRLQSYGIKRLLCCRQTPKWYRLVNKYMP